MSKEQRADDLERWITELDTLYDLGLDCIHPDTGIVVSDGEYDGFRRELKSLRPNSYIFKTVTASSAKGGIKKYKHHPPMTSIAKANHEIYDEKKKIFDDWFNDCLKKALQKGRTHFAQAYKLDGVALGLYYEKGKLVGAALRPRNGVDGEDVTEQVRYVKNIPIELKLPVTCSIRGELICRLPDFERLNIELAAAGEPLRANPRAAAVGIRQFKDPSKVKDLRLDFIAYGIEGLDSPPYKTEIDRAKWANQKLGIRFAQVRPFNFDDLQKMEDGVSQLDYEVDGVVVSVNDLEEQEQLGRHGDENGPKPDGDPRGKIAWKFAEETATPKLKNITAEIGRTGKWTPVAEFDSVKLAGTNVARATLHNAGFIERNGIGIGTVITVLKAGKIIPKVTGVVSGATTPVFPKNCPSCGTKLESNKTPGKEAWDLSCPNHDLCPAQNIGKFCHYLKVFGVLGLGESRVTQLIDGGKITKFADYYTLSVPEAMSCGMSERQALLAIAGIHLISSPDKYHDIDLDAAIHKAKKSKKKIPLWQLFASFGIESAGKSAGKALVSHFGNFDKIRQASKDELAAVDGVGDKTAEIVADYLEANRKDIDVLLKYVEPELPKTGKLTGEVFCFTGGFPEGKRYWEQRVEDLGGKCGSSVGSKTTYVVAGTDSGAKSQKAKELGIPILSTTDLEKML